MHNLVHARARARGVVCSERVCAREERVSAREERVWGAVSHRHGLAAARGDADDLTAADAEQRHRGETSAGAAGRQLEHARLGRPVEG